jgi:hypothetical protein
MTDAYDAFTATMDPKAQMLALADALRKQKAMQEAQQAELQQNYSTQQQQAGDYRALGLLSSLGANPLLSGIRQSALATGDDYQNAARGTLGLLRSGKTAMADPMRLLALQQAQERLALSGKREDRLGDQAGERIDLAKQRLAWQRSKAAAGAAAAQEKATKKEASDNIKLEGNLRKEFQALPAYKNFQIAAIALDQIQSAFKDPSAQGDLAGITAFMRSLDPSTGVKDQEFNNAQNAGGMLDKAAAALAKVQNGERLTPEQREGFLRVARSNVAALKKPHDAALKHYQELSKSYNVSPERVAAPASDIDLTQEPAPAPKQPTTKNLKSKVTVGGKVYRTYSDGTVTVEDE